MPIAVNAAKSNVDFLEVNAAKSQVDFVRVNAAKSVVYTRSDPQTQVFLPTNSLSYRFSGSNYSGGQLSGRATLAYYGRSSVREEGNMQLFDQAAIAAFLDVRPNVSQVIVRHLSQHTFSGTNTVSIQFHNQDPLPADQNTGWVTPIGPAKVVNFPKSTAGVRVLGTWTGAEAQTIGDSFRTGTFEGIATWIPGASVNDWGWGAGWKQRSTSETGGVPDGFIDTISSNRVELEFTADFS